MSVILQLRNDTSTNWTTYNPILAEGEIGIESDTKKIKVGDGVKTWTQLDYWVKPLTPEMITTALGFTPYDASNPDGFISGIDSTDVTNALGYTPYNSSNPDGFISGITSSDVIEALGFTPYDSSNPDGYTTNVGTVTSVNNIEPVNGNVTIETIEEGGSIGQVFVKKSNADYDVEWQSADDLRMFNKDAFTVVGSPTITDDGILSNTSQTNYVKKVLTNQSWNNFEITFDNIHCNTSNAIQVFFDMYGAGSQRICVRKNANGQIQLYISINNTVKLFNEASTISGKVGFDGTKYYWTINGVSDTLTSSTLLTQEDYTIYFGCFYDLTGGGLTNGSIDLKQFSITVDGLEVFNGSTTLSNRLADKVDKTATANRVYGTDAQGNQTTYDKNSFGQVDDVTVGGTSVVTNKVAVLGSMAGETASDYVLVSNVVNDVVSTDTDKPLSANMGKELQDEIDNLKAIGRFLSNWNCVTGLPTTTPPGLDTGDVFEYKVGDYYLVSNVASSGGTNYKPNGSTYVVGTPSTTVETDEVAVGDIYVYDSQNWLLLYNTKKTTTFANIAGDPYDNSNLASALNAKQDELPSLTGQASKFLTNNGTAISWGDAPVTDVQVDSTSIVSSGVANIPYGTNAVAGLAKAGSGLASMANGTFYIYPATEAAIQAKTNSANPIVPSNLNKAIMEGLGNNSLAWTDTYKANARNTIGATQAIFVDWSE